MAELVHPHDHGEEEGIEKLKNNLSNEKSFEVVSNIFQQLSDPTRIRIFWLLCHYEECVINISSVMEMSSPAVSHHLRALKSSGLIISRREGKEVYYRVADTPECRLLHKMIEEVMDITCPN